MSENPLVELNKYGQSVWLDFISRELLKTGGLQRLVDEDALSGVTSNPTIFEKAILEGHDYDEQIARLAGEGKEPDDIFKVIAADDIRAAADILRPKYDASGGVDGYASIEVAPQHAYDVEATVQQARELITMVDRPNVLVKVPATEEGIEAIRGLTAEGVSVNVTLLFSLERYRQVIDAYLGGLEELARSGGDPSKVFSVASFFVSRVDSSVDKQLDILERDVENEELARRVSTLKGKAAVANAKLAYQIYREAFDAPRFTALLGKGARPQRLLWASTGTKNPAYSDILYIQELIGSETVNTMTPATIDAFRDHGVPAETLTSDVEEATGVIEDLSAVGVDLSAITAALEQDGVSSFSASYDALIDRIRQKEDDVGRRIA